MITYYSDTVKFSRLKNPAVWVEVDTGSTAMFQSYPFFEFAPINGDEPLRYGDFVIDIDTVDTACMDAVKIVEWMDEIFGIEVEQWRIYLSGKKGVHLELPSEICGMTAGHVLLPMAYKRLAVEIQGELGVAIDTSMYNRGTGKPFRRPNVMREDTKTCKRQIEFDDLFEITDNEEYVAACSEPGPVWEPENKSVVENLKDKLDFFLEEVSKPCEIKPLNDKQSKILSAMLPPCIEKMRAMARYDECNDANFNDVAIQLTASYISAGKSEGDFLAGCGQFINQYPSSSLKTAEQRIQNCRARYRTMIVNGYQHSCGGIQALLHDNGLCSDCPFKPIAPRDDIQVMSADDFKGENDSIKITPGMIPDGLIAEGVEAFDGDIIQYDLPLVLSVISRTIAGKISFNGVHPNIFNVKVGDTSTGKSASDKRFLQCLNIDKFISLNDIASGPGLLRAISDNPVGMGLFDEITSMFRRSKFASDTTADGKADALLDIFSRSGQSFTKSYGDSRNNITIDNPCFTLLGNATPVIFDEIQLKDFETGLMQRFDFWRYDGPILPKKLLDQKYFDLTMKFVEKLGEIILMKPNIKKETLANVINSCVSLGITPGARSLAQDEYSAYVIEEANKLENSGLKGFMMRRFELMIKYALIHHCARNDLVLFDDLDERDIEYGILLAEALGGWKSNRLTGLVRSGDFHRDCETFKDAIKAAVKAGKDKPTFGILAGRKIVLKNWPQRHSAEVIDVLIKRGEITTAEGRKHTQYFLVKPENEKSC